MFVRKNKQKLAAIAHPGPRGGKSRQKPSKIPEFCLPTQSKSVREEAKVDKNRAKCLKFVYDPTEIGAHGGKSRQKPSKMSEICLPTRLKSVRAVSKVDKNRAKCLNFVYRLPEMVRASPKIAQKLEK